MTQTTAAKSVANVSHNVRRLLAVTMAVESLLVIGLTLRNFALATTPTATFFSVTLLAISGVGVWAAYATWVQGDSWLTASLLGQFSIAVLAARDRFQSPRREVDPDGSAGPGIGPVTSCRSSWPRAAPALLGGGLIFLRTPAIRPHNRFGMHP